MEWFEHMGNALTYIEQHLDQEISYEELASQAGCSPYYFQRIFSYITGISVSEYIRRRRMTQAGFDLQRTNRKVLDVALTYGYASPTSFNRAFQSVHGIPPTAAKVRGSKLTVYPAMHFSINVTGGEPMAYHLEEKDAFRIVGVRTALCENMEENQQNIPSFWGKTFSSPIFHTITELNNCDPSGILGVSVYEDPQHIYYYIATATTDDVKQGMLEYHIPASTWVVFENDGRFKEDVQSIFKRFYTEWLPWSGYEYAGLPDIEVYPIVKDTPLAGHSEVWIAIKQKEG